ncbi:MAG: DUF5398 family protein [Simkaniaceae bacterium]|nr:DUF5398 family protein [Simkaniaceae bacterium]
MFGLEKRKDKRFRFDLEKELQDPERRQEIISLADLRIASSRKALGQAVGKAPSGKPKDTDQHGILIQGYEALKTTVRKVAMESR